MSMRVLKFTTLFLLASAAAFGPQSARTHTETSLSAKRSIQQYDPLQLDDKPALSMEGPNKMETGIKALGIAALAIGTPVYASAATTFNTDAIPSALAAYGHYTSLLGLLACLMIERLTIKPNMSEKEENLLVITDTAYGVWGALIAYTGYLRTTTYEKGFAFYSHEPIFWLKICFLGIFGASSFFNTATIIKRGIAKSKGNFEPMSEKLAQRMIKICNAELVALSIIPLTATVMARGVLYSDSIPWQAEAGLDAAIFFGLSYKYIKEALTFED